MVFLTFRQKRHRLSSLDLGGSLVEQRQTGPAIGEVGFDLPVPSFGILRVKPVGKRCFLRGGKFGNRLFDRP
jgi:hypothetical protein